MIAPDDLHRLVKAMLKDETVATFVRKWASKLSEPELAIGVRVLAGEAPAETAPPVRPALFSPVDADDDEPRDGPLDFEGISLY